MHLCKCVGKWGLVAVLVCIGVSTPAFSSPQTVLRLDCGTADSPVTASYQRLTADQMYDPTKGFGWEGEIPTSMEFAKGFEFNFSTLGMYAQHIESSINDLNGDAVMSGSDLAFRADVPDGTYRVTVTIGNMREPLGSIDLYINDKLVGEHLAAWSSGSRPPHHRRLMRVPNGWWTNERNIVEVKDGTIRIRLTKNQTYYDEMLAKQAVDEKAWEDHIAATEGTAPYARVGIDGPPYYYIGWPFAGNSIMAIEIVPDKPAPVVGLDDKLTLTREIASPSLKEAIAKFNQEDFDGALQSIGRVTEPDAQVAKAIVMLWLAGRLEVEKELALVPSAINILKPYVATHPDENQVAEMLQDAEIFDKAMQIHLTRGEFMLGENHFVENGKALSWWWMIHKDTPLYYKARLHLARAEHMFIPYFPARGTYREVFKELEKKFPQNRFVKYHLHEVWEPHGDGSDFYDWYMKDYTEKVKDSPEWVRQLYPAFQTEVDWCEWWIRWRQQPEGSIGGGWGDDVEIIGAFGYMGYVSRDISDILVQGTAKLVEGVWSMSEVDPEIGYCMPFNDAEHTAEWTGNTLGMMAQIDYGSPTWIERCTKTGKLMRDLWTDLDDNGHRHFRANFFSAAQVGSGNQMNDSWINYRAIRPAHFVLSYNRNPAIAKVITELADGWAAAAMSTDRGKPRGVIPTEIAFPSGLIGGQRSPNWYTAYHGPGTGNADWKEQPVKPYIQDLLMGAYRETRDPKYIEPLQLEYELAAKYDNLPATKTGARLQQVEYPQEFGKRDRRPPAPPKQSVQGEKKPLEPGTEEWVSANLKNVNEWLIVKRMVEGREGKLENDITKEDVIRSATLVNSTYKWFWPISTTEAGPTDRIAFFGLINPFLIYTGGRIGGPLLEAAVTYSDTTRDFAAVVLASDPQGLRLLYHSLTDDARDINIHPWYLEPGGRYKLTYGPDANEDEIMDRIAEERDFDFQQAGLPVTVTVEPRITYVVEVDQIQRGTKSRLAPDPGLSPSDIRLEEGFGLRVARIHNVGSQAARRVEVAAYDGDPDAGGTLIGTSLIPNIDPPNDLQSETVNVAFNWGPGEETHEIYIVVDPNDEIKDEITTFNNVAHTTLPKQEDEEEPIQMKFTGSFRGGRGR